MDLPTLIALSAALIALAGTAHSFFKDRPLVPASELKDLRAELTDLRNKLSQASSDIAILKAQLGQAITEREWWREQYRQAKELLDQMRNPMHFARGVKDQEQ